MSIIHELKFNNALSSFTLTFKKHKDYMRVNKILDNRLSVTNSIRSMYEYKVSDDAGSDINKKPSEYTITISNINQKEMGLLISFLHKCGFLTVAQKENFQEACNGDRISVKPSF